MRDSSTAGQDCKPREEDKSDEAYKLRRGDKSEEEENVTQKCNGESWREEGQNGGPGTCMSRANQTTLVDISFQTAVSVNRSCCGARTKEVKRPKLFLRASDVGWSGRPVEMSSLDFVPTPGAEVGSFPPLLDNSGSFGGGRSWEYQ